MPTPNTTASIGDIDAISLLQESGMTAQEIADAIKKSKNSTRPITTDSEIDGSLKSKQELMYCSIFQNSINNSRVKYEDSLNSIFREDWTTLLNWSTTSSLQISNNKLYSTGSGGGASGINKAFIVNSTENARVLAKINIPTGLTSGGVMIGVSTDATGSIPDNAGGNAYGLYLSSIGAKQINDGVITDLLVPQSFSAGVYIVSINIDANYISVSANNVNNTTIEYTMRVSRSGISINNIFLFNSDSRGLTGSYIDVVSGRKELSSLYPRTDIEGIAKTVQWTGDGTQNFKIYLPKNYDSRKSYPAIIGFHGNGSTETFWSSNGNMRQVQEALVNDGYIFIGVCHSTNYSTWGNSQSTTAYYKAYKYLLENYSISNIGFYSNSMGGIESLNVIVLEQIPCSAWCGTAPTTNLLNNFNNPTFKDIIKNAYGISADYSDYSSKTVGRDPMLNSNEKFRGLPMLFIAATDDVAVNTVENTDAFIAKIQPHSLYIEKITVASGGHSFNNTPYLNSIIVFFNKYIKNIY